MQIADMKKPFGDILVPDWQPANGWHLATDAQKTNTDE